MKPICILVQNVYDFDVRVRRKAEALVAAGYSVDVFGLRKDGGPKEYNLRGVNVYTVSLGKQRGSLARYAFEYLSFFLWSLVKLTVEMRRKRYAVIDVNTLPDFLIFAGIFARWMGAKLVLDMHEITPEFYMSKYEIPEQSWRIRALTVLEKWSFDFADHVVTINEPIQELLVSRGLPREKSTVVMNSADEASLKPQTKSVPAIEAAASAASFVMMYHGTLTRLYGLDIAIEAFASRHSEMPGAEFWILGSGTQTSELRALIQKFKMQDKIKLIGFVSPLEIPAWLTKCDLGVLPIRRDVFLEFASPNKLPEFIVMGKAVVISRLKAIQYYFTNDAVAFFEPNDPLALAGEMVRLYRDAGLRASMVAQARRQYAPLRWEVMKERYLTLIAEICGHPKLIEQSISR